MQTAPVAALWREEHAYFGRLLDLLARRLPRLRPQLEVVWRAVTALSPVDWQAVADSVGVAFDPLFGATPRERYRELLGSLRGPQRTP